MSFGNVVGICVLLDKGSIYTRHMRNFDLLNSYGDMHVAETVSLDTFTKLQAHLDEQTLEDRYIFVLMVKDQHAMIPWFFRYFRSYWVSMIKLVGSLEEKQVYKNVVAPLHRYDGVHFIVWEEKMAEDAYRVITYSRANRYRCLYLRRDEFYTQKPVNYSIERGLLL